MNNQFQWNQMTWLKTLYDDLLQNINNQIIMSNQYGLFIDTDLLPSVSVDESNSKVPPLRRTHLRGI